VLLLLAGDESDDFLLMLWCGGTVLPFGLCNATLTLTRHSGLFVLAFLVQILVRCEKLLTHGVNIERDDVGVKTSGC